MIEKKLSVLMSLQKFAGERSANQKIEASKKLNDLNIPKSSEFFKFYEKYNCGHINHNPEAYAKVNDLLPPQNLIRTADMAHNYWNIPKNYILFTDGVGEGGYFYNIEDNSVWDCGLGEQHLLGTDKLKHWDSFYEFMLWYLTPGE